MTDKVQKVREEVERLQNELIQEREKGYGSDVDNACILELQNVLTYIDSLQEEPVIVDVPPYDYVKGFSDGRLYEKRQKEEPVSIWHDASEMPKEKKVCIIRYSTNDGASTNNFEVVIAEPLTRRFVTRSYPHKTGYQHTIHSENTIKVDEYQDRREYIPFSDIDEWAYIDDLLNLSNVQRTVKEWKEPVSEELDEAADNALSNVLNTHEIVNVRSCLEMFRFGAEWQKKQDQETIELAEDHAMLAGIIKGTEHTIGKVRSILNKVAYRNNGLDVNGDYCEQPYVELDNEFKKLLKED